MKKLLSRKKYSIDDGITQSMLGTFLSCRERSRLTLDGWQSILSKGDAFLRGDFVHLFLENFYNGNKADPLLPYLFDNWRSDNKLEDNKGTEIIYDICSELLPRYISFWSKSDSKKEWKNLEFTFDVIWRKKWRLRGKIDGIFKIFNQYWILETKTKAQIDEEGMTDALAFDFQNLFYLTVLRECFGINARGVLYNVIRWPSTRLKQNLGVHIDKDMTHYFKRFEVAYSDKGVERFQNELEFKLEDFANWIVGSDHHYKNETACFKGNMKCEFLKACSTGSMLGYKRDRILFRELI